jgi:coenzyme PQQ precursor peptide PqqA
MRRGRSGWAAWPPRGGLHPRQQLKEIIMAWTKPAAVDMRYGFEINLYVAAR